MYRCTSGQQVRCKGLGLLLVGLAFTEALGCSAELSLEERPCPCAEGWTCCVVTNRCQRSAEACPRPPRDLKELTVWYGMPGGKGTADGVGSKARFSAPGRMVGDEQYLYVTDAPAFMAPHSTIAASEDTAFLSCCKSSNDCAAECGRLPRGVRRIAIKEGRVEWLVSDRLMAHLAIDVTGLFGTTGAPACETCRLERASTVVRIDPTGGAWSTLAGTEESDSSRDGVGAGARFRSIQGLAADGMGALYSTDGVVDDVALRKIDVETGAVTTLAATTGWSGETTAQSPPVIAPFGMLGAVVVHDGSVYALGLLVHGTDGKAAQSVWRLDPVTHAVTELQAPLPSFSPISLLASCPSSKGMLGVIGDCVAESYPGLIPTYCGPQQFTSPNGLWCSGQEGYVAQTDAATVVRASTDWELAGASSHVEKLERPVGLSSNSAGDIVFFSAKDRTIVHGWTEVPHPAVPAFPAPLSLPEHNLPFALDPNGDCVYTPYTPGGMLIAVPLNPHAECVQVHAPEASGDLVHDGSRYLYFSTGNEEDAGCSIGRARTDQTSPTEKLIEGYCGVLAIDGTKDLFVAQSSRDLHRIDLATRKVTPLPSPADGWLVTALAHDRAGVLYVAEGPRSRVRGLNTVTGQIFDVVGREGSRGVQLGSLPASLNYPVALTVLPEGELAIADYEENVILIAR